MSGKLSSFGRAKEFMKLSEDTASSWGQSLKEEEHEIADEVSRGGRLSNWRTRSRSGDHRRTSSLRWKPVPVQ